MQFLCEPVFGRMEVTRLGILQSTEVQSGWNRALQEKVLQNR